MNISERILEFDVIKQRITRRKSCDFTKIVAGSSGYLRAKFYFSQSEWRGCKKAASFWLDNEEYGVLLDKNDTCLIPAEALAGSKFEVSVTGVRPNSDYRITTNKTKVKQEVH